MLIALQSLRTLVFRIVCIALGQILGLLVARWLGPSGYGFYGLILIFAAFALQIPNGMLAAVAHQITNRGVDARTIAANTAALTALAAAPIVLASLLAWPLLSTHHWAWLVPVALAVPAYLLYTAALAIFLGVSDLARMNYALGFPPAAGLAFFLVLSSLFGRTAGVALTSWGLSNVVAALMAAWFARRYWAPLFSRSVSSERVRWLAGFGLHVGLTNIVALLNFRIDQGFVRVALDQRAFGIYLVAVNTAEGIWWFADALAIGAYSRLGSLPVDEATRLAARLLRHSLFVLGAAALALIVIANPLLTLLYGSAYRQAIAPFRWLLPGAAAYGMSIQLYAYYINQLGRPRVPLQVAGLSVVLTSLLCLVLVPRLGLTGAAISSTAGYTIATFAGLMAFQRRTHRTWREILILDFDDIRAYLHLVRTLFGILRRRSPLVNR